MNYEALGRYTEAKEQLALLQDDIADQIRMAQSALEVLAREVPPRRSHPRESAERLRQLAARIAQKRLPAKPTPTPPDAADPPCGVRHETRF